MINKIEHLMNLDEPRFVMIGGLQGSGKSTLVKEFKEVGYNVVCPDSIRFELARQVKGRQHAILEGEVADIMENFSPQAWKIAGERVLDFLSKNQSVVFDSTNLTVKARKQIIQFARTAGKDVIAVYLECPVELALDRNTFRGTNIEGYNRKGEPVYGRQVPPHVIELKAITQVLPTKREGFSEVHILHVHDEIWVAQEGKQMLIDLYKSKDILKLLTDWKNSGTLGMMLPTFNKCWGIDQENKHHMLPLHMHMIEVAKTLQKEPFPLFLSGLLHDVGKFPTKRKYGKIIEPTEVFSAGEKVEIKPVEGHGSDRYMIARKLDYKGDRSESVLISNIILDPNAHYYQHELVGAVIARRELDYLEFDEDILNEVYSNILYHMELPTKDVPSKKTLKNLIDRIGPERILSIIKLKEADKKASGTNDEYIDTIHEPTVQLIYDILAGG
jgi:predicted kinase